jgi:hypothetical protein
MGETSPRVFRRPDGQPYSPGTITETAYVLKSTDQWLPDVGPDGVIWSGGRSRIKSNQHPARYILRADGTVLRAPLPGGEDRPVLAGPRSSRSDRRTAAGAIAALGMAGVGPHLYVVGEREEPDGPVKIGLNSGGASRTGRAGLSIGNWRHLGVLHRKAIALEDLRWTEWIIHKHLTGGNGAVSGSTCVPWLVHTDGKSSCPGWKRETFRDARPGNWAATTIILCACDVLRRRSLVSSTPSATVASSSKAILAWACDRCRNDSLLSI